MRRRFAVAFGLGAGVIAIAFVLDVAGQDYLVAKNVLLALPVLAVAAGVALASAGRAGIAATVLVCAGFVAIAIAAQADRSLRRPDMRAAAQALGAPKRGEAVVTVYHGGMPLLHYRPGGADAGAGGQPVRDLEVVLPLARGDAPGPTRAPTPPAPPGFALAGREERPGFSLIRYRAAAPTPLDPAAATALAPGTATFPSVVLVWP